MIPAEDRLKNLAMFNLDPHAFMPFEVDSKGRLLDAVTCIVCHRNAPYVAHDADLRGGEAPSEYVPLPEDAAPKKRNDKPLAAGIALAIAFAYIGFLVWYPHVAAYLRGFGV